MENETEEVIKMQKLKENEQLTFWKQNMPVILVPDSVANENKYKKMKWDFPRQTNVNVTFYSHSW